MSSMLFAIEVVVFVLLAYWARRNDSIGFNEGGTGLFAIKDASTPDDGKTAATPKWKRQMAPKSGGPKLAVPSVIGQQPQWKTALLPHHKR